MMKKYRVGIIGATGMVGQRFATLLVKHFVMLLRSVCVILQVEQRSRL